MPDRAAREALLAGTEEARRMKLNSQERSALLEALDALEDGDHRRFQDLLWLGFGDRWTDVRRALVRESYIVDHGDDDAEVSPRGKRLISRLTKPLSRAG